MHGKKLVIQFWYNLEKWLKKDSTKFCGSLILIKQSGDEKSMFLFCFLTEKLYHTISIYGNYMTSNFLMTTQKFFQITFILPQNFFWFVFQLQIELCTQTNMLHKKKQFCLLNLFFLCA